MYFTKHEAHAVLAFYSLQYLSALQVPTKRNWLHQLMYLQKLAGKSGLHNYILTCYPLPANQQTSYRRHSYLFGAQFMCCLHEVGTQHGEGHTVTMLSRELHTLLELMLKYWCVETGINKAIVVSGYGTRTEQNLIFFVNLFQELNSFTPKWPAMTLY